MNPSHFFSARIFTPVVWVAIAVVVACCALAHASRVPDAPVTVMTVADTTYIITATDTTVLVNTPDSLPADKADRQHYRMPLRPLTGKFNITKRI
jgi:hypothetical protein